MKRIIMIVSVLVLSVSACGIKDDPLPIEEAGIE
tara:strand:+ start:1559 stop:1660 length:102 start_codon:yes stop_codon:yes gene_type:complete